MLNIINSLTNKFTAKNKDKWTEDEIIDLARQLNNDWLGAYGVPVSKGYLETYIERRMVKLPKSKWDIWTEWDASKALSFYRQYWKCRLGGHIHHLTTYDDFLNAMGAPEGLIDEVSCWLSLFGINVMMD
jgi:hypothetical protein